MPKINFRFGTGKYFFVTLLSFLLVFMISCSKVDDTVYDYTGEISALNQQIIDMRAMIEELESTVTSRDSTIADLNSKVSDLESRFKKIDKTLSIVKMKMSIMEVDKF